MCASCVWVEVQQTRGRTAAAQRRAQPKSSNYWFHTLHVRSVVAFLYAVMSMTCSENLGQGRYFWEQEVAGSNPAAPIYKSLKSRCFLAFYLVSVGRQYS
jgi:hypothetical protein